MRQEAEIDIGVIRRNIRRVRALTSVRLLLMVKADAYGHGMEEVARQTEEDVNFFGVAVAEEGVALRRQGRKRDVLVAVCEGRELPLLAAHGLTAAVADGATLAALAALPERQRPRFHLKFDTGMHRLGFPAEDVGAVLDFLHSNRLKPDGAYSHFREANEEQNALFRGVAALVKRDFPDATVHMASSSSLFMKDAAYDMVRIGHAAYDGAMTVTSPVIAVRKVKKGECIGYGNFRVSADVNIAVVLGGYFDGVSRRSPSPVMIGGRLCPALGSVCMDMFAVETGDIPVKKGDRAVLLGGSLTAAAVAKARGCTEYEVMTAWQGRTHRSYVDKRGSQKES